MIYENLNNMENNSFGALLDVIPFATYVIDIETFHVVYINKVLAKKVSSPKKEFCWEKIYGQDDKCSWCTISKLTFHKRITNTFFDESADIWLQAYDELIIWPNGRVVKCTIAIDISEQKEMQSSLIKAHTKLAIQTKKLKETNEKLELLSKIDYLTKINNRRNFFYLGEALYENDLECNEDIFIAMFDLDNFKQFNDTYGHHLGDEALIAFTRRVETNISKETDIFGRLGGEEFALIVRSSCENAIFQKIDIIRKSIANIILYEDSKEINFTVSVVLVKREVSETLDATLEKADKLLYEEKNSVRNQIKFRL